MRRFLVLMFTSLVILSAGVFLSGTVYATVIDYVDIGDDTSEAGHELFGWGPIEPATHGGNWGGGSADGTCRVISSSNDDWASIKLQFVDGVNVLELVHLEGQAIDSFKVYVDSMSTSIFTFDASGYGSTEKWMTTYVPLTVSSSGFHTIYFLSTGTHWSGYGTYGQVAFSSMSVEPIPEPASLLLLGSGLLGLAAFARRKRER